MHVIFCFPVAGDVLCPARTISSYKYLFDIFTATHPLGIPQHPEKHMNFDIHVSRLPMEFNTLFDFSS
jgi:hypothetical protein